MSDKLLLLFRAQVVGTYSDTDTEIELSDVSRLVGELPLNLNVYSQSLGTPADSFEQGAFEVWRVTDVDSGTNTVTVIRGQEGTTPITITSDTWQVYQSINPKTIEDLDAKIDSKEPADSTILKEVDVIDNLASTEADKPLSANQGRILDESKEDADATILKQANVVDNLTSTEEDKPLSANQGRLLDEGKVSKTSDTGSAIIPTGTEAQRDETPFAGLFRFNEDTGEFEGYDGEKWGNIRGLTGIVFGDTIEITATEAGDTFALGELVSSGLVSVNGAWVKESDYSFSGTNIVFGYSLELDDEILIKPVIENVSDVEGGGITFNNAIEVNATGSGTTFALGEVVTKALVSVNGAWVAPTEFSFSGENIVFGFSLDEGDQILVYPVYQYINQTEVIDNLESTETGKALSANQGNLIKQLIDALDTDKVEKSGDTMSGLLRLTAGLNFNASGGDTLSDYEVGTWTPSYLTTGNDFDSISYSNTYGYFVRIGNIVFAHFRIRTTNITKGGASGNVRIGGYPFTSFTEPIGSLGMAGSVGFQRNFINPPKAIDIIGNSTEAVIRKSDIDSEFTVDDLDYSGSSKNELSATIAYRAS